MFHSHHSAVLVAAICFLIAVGYLLFSEWNDIRHNEFGHPLSYLRIWCGIVGIGVVVGLIIASVVI